MSNVNMMQSNPLHEALSSTSTRGVLLVVSPIVPMWLLGVILTRCVPFNLDGVRLIRLDYPQAHLLGKYCVIGYVGG